MRRIMAFSALLVVTALCLGSAALATPHATPKSCGYAGGPSCPATPPTVGPWFYSPWQPFVDVVPPNGFYTVSEVGQWFQAFYPTEPEGYCSQQLNYGGQDSYPPPAYFDGLLQRYYATITLNQVWSTHLTPSCTYNGSVQEQYSAARALYCPAPTNTVYQTNPTVGPYCALPSGTPNWPKAAGPCCSNGGDSGSNSGNSGAADAGSGGTVKGNPVDVANGNKFETEVDYAGVSTSPIRFVRTYNSLQGYLALIYSGKSLTQPLLGAAGWSATYFQYLLPVTVTDSTTTYSAVYAYRPDGRVLVFNLYNGVYSPDGDVADSLSQSASGWQYQTADDTIETYNASGYLLSVATRGRAPVTVNYSSNLPDNVPASVSDPFGHTLQFSYLVDAANTQRLGSITDPNGATIAYGYDSNGRLSTVTYQDNTQHIYGYDAAQNRWLLASVTDEANILFASWTYQNYGAQIATSQHAGGVDSYQFTSSLSGSGGSVTVTDPLGESRTYNQSLVWGRYRMTGSSTVCPGCGEDQSRVLDANGNIAARTDFNGNETTYVYDVTQNLETSRTEGLTNTGATTPRTRTLTTQWDPSWRQRNQISVYAGGTATGTPLRTTGVQYDSMGNALTKTVTDTTVTPNVVRTWTYTYDSYGRMLTAKGPRTDVDTTTTYTYYTCTSGYQCGQLQTVTDVLGHITTFNTYSAHGQPLTTTDPNGVVTTLTYDARMRLTSRQVGTETTSFTYWPTGLLKQVTLPDGSYVLYTYDAAHRLTHINDGAGNSIQYTLDAMGNRTAENRYDPSSVLHYTHSRVINALNELYQDVNAAGTAAVTTTFGYDNNGNQTSITAPLSRNTTNAYDELNRLKQITDPGNGVTQFAYDAEDDLTSVIDPRNLTTSYTYNGFGDVKVQTSPDTAATTNTYDSGGNLATSTDARGAVATDTYDALNRVTSIAYSRGGVTDQTISFTYDAGTYGKGRLTGASDASHLMSWTYDALGRVTNKSQRVNGVTKSVGYAYANGDLTTLTTPSGQTITYGYNTNHQITGITVNGTLTVLSNVTYEPFGAASGWTWGNGTRVSRSYDTDEKITQISSAGVKGYGYDNAFRITALTDTSTGAVNWTYGYDLLDRLSSATNGTVTRGWTYDANGNRATETGSSPSTYTSAASSNRMTGISGALNRSYSYDASGNTLTYGTFTHTYNNRARLISLSNSGTGVSASYVYNALGQLIETTGTNGTTLYYYDEAAHLLGYYGPSGGLAQETVWLGDIPVATLRPSGSSVAVYYVHSDHLNTPRQVTRPSDGIQMWTWFSEPFGNTNVNTNPQGAGVFNYQMRFAGQINASGVNMMLPNYFRDYDPITGRYIESDPIGLMSGVNTYTYVRANPLSFYDPKGLIECPAGLLPDPGGGNWCVDNPRYSGPPYCPNGDCAFYGAETNCACMFDCKEREVQKRWACRAIRSVGRLGVPGMAFCELIIAMDCSRQCKGQCDKCK